MPGEAVVTIGQRNWRVSLATSYAEVTRGLGGIDSIPAGTGMLFDMGYDHLITVTTVPMRFPLDIAFISSGLRVSEVARGIPPGLLVTSDAPARYFLEVNAGEMAKVQVDDPVGVRVTAYPEQSAQLTAQAFNWGLALTLAGVIGDLALKLLPVISGKVEEAAG